LREDRRSKLPVGVSPSKNSNVAAGHGPATSFNPGWNRLVSGVISCLLRTPSRVLIQQKEFGDLEAAFEKLPEDYREVILQCRLLGVAPAEIATQRSRSENAVRILLSRALSRLASLVETG
jgi:DNA-directed RNA polymerase specialized sigma24 family protein